MRAFVYAAADTTRVREICRYWCADRSGARCVVVVFIVARAAMRDAVRKIIAGADMSSTTRACVRACVDHHPDDIHYP